MRSLDDPRVTYDRLPKNVGLHGNLSRCLRLGSGRFLTVLCDDDVLLPGSLAARTDFLSTHPSAGFVHSRHRRLTPDGRYSAKVSDSGNLARDTLEPGDRFIWRTMQQGALVSNPTVMLRREAVAGERFDPADGPYCDNGLWLRVARSWDVGYLTRATAAYRVQPLSYTATGGLRRARKGRVALTTAHARATYAVNRRFLELPGHAPEQVRIWRRLLLRGHIRSWLAIALHHRLPKRLVRRVRHALAARDAKVAERALVTGSASPPPRETIHG